MSAEKEEVVESPEIHFEPIVKLAPVEIKSTEEDEEELFKIRAKLFRFEAMSDPPEWKERGIGEVKLLRHKKNMNIRLIMRRDKTHKICANHYLTKDMKLLPSVGSDKAWVYTVQADFADEEAKVEQLAIRFKNAENAQKFKDEFEKAQSMVVVMSQPDQLTQEMEKLSVVENKNTEQKNENENETDKTTTKTETETRNVQKSPEKQQVADETKPTETN